jgi:hypothetical protein
MAPTAATQEPSQVPMFESIVVRSRSSTQEDVDLGLLAEALLFYQNVSLIVDSRSLASLLGRIGPDSLLRVMSRIDVKQSFLPYNIGVQTANVGGLAISRPIAFSRISKEKGRYSREDDIALTVERTLGKSWASRRTAKALIQCLPLDRSVENVTSMINEDFRDTAFVNRAALLALHALVPNVSIHKNAYFFPIEVSGGFMVDTNLSFQEINVEYHKFVPPKHSSISPPLLLSILSDARSDLALSAGHMGELLTTSLSSKILELKFKMMLEKRLRMSEEIEVFQRTYLTAKSIREAINSGQQSFAKFLDLLEKSDKFKKFPKEAHPSEGLAKEFYNSATGGTWAEALPTKTVRIAFFTGAGALTELLAPTGLGLAAGVALSTADSFLVDRILKGWRPNQFVERYLRPFVGSD